MPLYHFPAALLSSSLRYQLVSVLFVLWHSETIDTSTYNTDSLSDVQLRFPCPSPDLNKNSGVTENTGFLTTLCSGDEEPVHSEEYSWDSTPFLQSPLEGNFFYCGVAPRGLNHQPATALLSDPVLQFPHHGRLYFICLFYRCTGNAEQYNKPATSLHRAKHSLLIIQGILV